MLTPSIINEIIPILKKDARRALKMRVSGFPSPYYCSFILRDLDWFNTWASSGSTYRKRRDRNRHVFCDIRVGSYRYDQTSEGGLRDNDEEIESYSHVKVPIDDSEHQGLRLALWRLSETKFREAVADYQNKRGLKVSTVDPNSRLPSFTKIRRVNSIDYAAPERVDEAKWVRFCKQASAWMGEFKGVFGNYVDFSVDQESKIFVSTEGSVIVQHSQVFSLTASFRKLTREGSHLEQELVINCATQKELPDLRTFKRLAREKYDQLMQLTKAQKIHAFSGPVLLYPGPAGLLFHEAIGHRLEGSRLLSSGEGQTFKGQIGKRVLSLDLNIRDNPKLKTFKGKRCIGAYDYDDEGCRGSDTLLIENGLLKGFLNTRAQMSKKGYAPNGHARNKKHQRPISRMAVTIIEGKKTVNYERLKEMLVREINRQRKPFGMIVYETSGGETETTTYDFQAFFGEISFASLVYPDGRELPVRGVNFVGTPMQALHNIIAVGDTQELENHYCGAESGFIPVSTISPAILLKDLELQAKDEELVTQYILSQPKSRK